MRYFSFAFASVAPLTMTRASYSGVFVRLFETRREVYSIANDGVIEPLFRAHVAGNYNTSVNSNADTDRGQAAPVPLLVQLIERRNHL